MSLVSLGSMVFWGMVLCFCYQLFLPFAEKTRSTPAAILLYGGAGLLCFLLTALFLYCVNGGEWGLYGFFALIFGFVLYDRFCRCRIHRFALRVEFFLSGLHRSGMRLGHKVMDAVTLPFGKIVDKGIAWTEKKEIQKEKDLGGMS